MAKKSAKKNLGIGMDKAEASDLPLWLEETGPTSCPGTNDTSLTPASALWAADYTLYSANFGAERMAMHSKLGACEAGHRCRRSAIRRQPAEPDKAEGILSRPSLTVYGPSNDAKSAAKVIPLKPLPDKILCNGAERAEYRPRGEFGHGVRDEEAVVGNQYPNDTR